MDKTPGPRASGAWGKEDIAELPLLLPTTFYPETAKSPEVFFKGEALRHFSFKTNVVHWAPQSFYCSLRLSVMGGPSSAYFED
jgi:hypothetical protein